VLNFNLHTYLKVPFCLFQVHFEHHTFVVLARVKLRNCLRHDTDCWLIIMSFFLSPYHPCSPLAALLLRLFVIVCSIPLLRILVSPVDFGPQDYICLKSSQVIVTSLPRKWYKTCNSSESQGSSQVLIMLWSSASSKTFKTFLSFLRFLKTVNVS
jgi:hypothetical protein